ncbi:hypothetical protein P5G62_009975 [Neobacillus sp. 179-C4.2 HS]|uniref:Uncharacterized protein n=1 Tax=Neobacillus driksii TaxID=3035913 RepID=A0ABV4YTL2_9BACI|nr:hypothetical protein [Neobacillus sp. 179.-C4.2 HS]MDP5195010.1 hypothetical protein [Neobacillus sp. 179.-C4.2 HS]
MKLDLMKLFDGYVRNYHTLNLTVHHGRHSFTMSEIEYFLRLGSMLGFLPYTEDTCNGTYRAMDMTWWDNFDGDYWHDFILHLERENSLKKDLETLEKLFDERESVPQNVIGIMNVKNATKIEELITEAKNRCKINNALLIFRTNSIENDKGYFDEVHAYLLHKNTVKKTKTAYVSDISGTLYMQFEHPKP